MYSINTPRLNIQTCQYCKNKYVEYIGTQAWCSSCQKTVNTIQQQIKVVPKLYQSNSKYKVNSAQIKIKNYITEFCNKFGGISDNQQLHHLYMKAIQLKDKKGTSTKNYRQNSAVIVYIHCKDLHKLSIKQYCKKNQLQIKSFNKSYLTYQKIIKMQKNQIIGNYKINDLQIKKQINQDIFLKNEELNESSHQDMIQIVKRQSLYESQIDHVRQKRFCELSNIHYPETSFQYIDNVNQQQNATIQIMIQKNRLIKKQVNHFIQAVFGTLFSSSLYIDKKSLLISQLSDRTIQMYKSITFWKESSIFNNLNIFNQIDDRNFYKYFLFLVLKAISFNINQLKYRQIIQKSTGQSIKSTVLKQLIKFYISNQENLSSSGESINFIENSGSTGSQYVKIEQKQSNRFDY